MLATFLEYPTWGERFLAELEKHGMLNTAARAVGTTPKQVERYTENNDEFAEHVSQSLEIAADVLEAEARRRAVNGIEKGVYYKGDLVATETQYSDTLLIKLLEAKRRQQFGNKIDITHSAPSTILIRDFTTDQDGNVIDAEFTPIKHTQILAAPQQNPIPPAPVAIHDLC